MESFDGHIEMSVGDLSHWISADLLDCLWWWLWRLPRAIFRSDGQSAGAWLIAALWLDAKGFVCQLVFTSLTIWCVLSVCLSFAKGLLFLLVKNLGTQSPWNLHTFTKKNSAKIRGEKNVGNDLIVGISNLSPICHCLAFCGKISKSKSYNIVN